MALINHGIPNLFNGISQQSASIRQPSQCELQENAFSSIVDGVHKRHASVNIGKLDTVQWTNAFVHIINRDPTERYVVAVQGGVLKVWDVFGVAKTVTAPGGFAYLTSAAPQTDIRMVTIADYTFIVNKAVVTAMNAATAVATPTVVQTFSKLPTTGVVGTLYKITGDNTNQFGAYYVIWNGSAYVEAPAGGQADAFNPTTMPYTLVRNPDGTFTFAQATWQARLCGDNNSIPTPSFIGKAITDVVFYRNRLGFISGQNVIFSRAGSFFSFWGETATQVLATDPIDVAVSHTKVSTLRAAIPFSRNLLLFSDQTQFVLAATDTLTPQTVVIHATTEFECSSGSKPIALGSNVYFAVDRSGFTGFREYFVSSYQLTFDATDVTAHVPRYVPGGVTKMCGSTNEDVLFALSSQDPSAVFVYKYYWDGDTKAQSSWSRWTLGGSSPKILSMEMMNTKLYLVVQRPDGVYLEMIDVQVGLKQPDLPMLIHLDRKAYLTGTYNVVTNKTTWTLPYAESGVQVVLGGSFVGRAGVRLNTTAVNSTTIQASGDYSAFPVYAGVPYTMRYRFSKQYYRDQSKAPVANAILKLRNFRVVFNQSGYFRAEVTPIGRQTEVYQFTGKVLGTTALTLGAPQLDNGVFRFPVMTDGTTATIELVNDSYLPSFFQSAEWEGMMTMKSQRV